VCENVGMVKDSPTDGSGPAGQEFCVKIGYQITHYDVATLCCTAKAIQATKPPPKPPKPPKAKKPVEPPPKPTMPPPGKCSAGTTEVLDPATNKTICKYAESMADAGVRAVGQLIEMIYGAKYAPIKGQDFKREYKLVRELSAKIRDWARSNASALLSISKAKSVPPPEFTWLPETPDTGITESSVLRERITSAILKLAVDGTLTPTWYTGEVDLDAEERRPQEEWQAMVQFLHDIRQMVGKEIGARAPEVVKDPIGVAVKSYNYLSEKMASLWGLSEDRKSSTLLWLTAAGIGLYLLWGRHE
jgi:hypothetical protein